MGFELQILPSLFLFFLKLIVVFNGQASITKRILKAYITSDKTTDIWREFPTAGEDRNCPQKRAQRAYWTNLIFAFSIFHLRRRFPKTIPPPRFAARLRVRGRLKTERKILIESSSAPKKIWKKRKGEKGKKKSETKEPLEPRDTCAILRENCDSFFRAPFEPASGFSHAFLRNYRCQDYREGRLCVYCFAVEYGERRPGRGQDFDPCLRFLRASACVSRRTISLSRLRYDDLGARYRDRFDMRG